MKILQDGSVISNDGIYIGRASAEYLEEYVDKGIFKSNGDGTYSGTYDGKPDASLAKAKQYLREHNLTVQSPSGFWMTPEDAAKRNGSSISVWEKLWNKLF